MASGFNRGIAAFLLGAVLAGSGSPATSEEAGGLRFLGAAEIATGTGFEGTVVGGLSGLAWRGGTSWLAVSDDRVAPRAYDLTVSLRDGRLAPDGIRIDGLHFLKPAGGPRFDARLDPEGIGIGPGGWIYIADEGHTRKGGTSQVRIFNSAFLSRGRFDPPAKIRPDGFGRMPGTRGVRGNFGFESIAITPDGSRLFTATEQALRQDGPAVGPATGSRTRLYAYDLTSGAAGPEYVYPLSPVPGMLPLSFTPEVSGLVELLALDDHGGFLALERSYTLRDGFSARLYRIDTAGATDVSGDDSLPEGAVPVGKRELLDLGDLGIDLDNMEGMAIGPALDGGERLLLLVSDNNFRPLQKTLFLAFALDPAAAQIATLGPPDPDPD